MNLPDPHTLIMKVNDIFHFQDGRIVFVGEVTKDYKPKPSTYALYVDGDYVRTVSITGVEIPLNKKHAVKDKALSTTDCLALGSISPQDHRIEFWMVS